MEMKDVLRKVDKAKFELMISRGTTFFSSLLAGMKYIYNEEHQYAATDGMSIWLNPYFINTLSVPEIIGLLLHEIGHVIYEHIIICFEGNLDPETHNIAGDHYINLWLLAMGYTLPLSVPGCADKKYLGWSTMKIYLDLLKNPHRRPKNYVMDIRPAPKGMSKAEHSLKITNNIMKAAIQAEMSKDAGSIPAEIRQMIEKIRSPELPWEVILANHMSTYARDDYSWSRPNKRFLPDYYMPSLHSLHMDQMTAGLDVSGSTTGPVLNLQFAEVLYLWDTIKPKRMHMMSFDEEVHLNHMYSEGDSLEEVELFGGGGTNVGPLLDSIRDENPTVALIFTDGYFSMPSMKGIESDVIWIITNNPGFTAPKGKVIYCTV